MRHAPALFAALLLSACMPDARTDAPGAYRTLTRGNLVLPDPEVPGQFEVFARAGDGPAEYWCAAAEYAKREFRAAPNARIYVVIPRGRSQNNPGRNSTVFTLRPDAATQAAAAVPKGDDLSMSVDRIGNNYRMAHGLIACQPIYEWPLDPGGS